ncbi:MAG: DUF1595 domain-containing protein, partial [Myxococcota bacterium]
MRRTSLVLALSFFVGCVGSIGDVGNQGGPGSGPDGTDPTDPRLDARAWRLTPAQYNTEVQRLFPGAPPVSLPAGASEFGITNNAATARIDLGNVVQYTEAARIVGNWVADQGADAARCDSFGTGACVDQFLAWFPAAAYRRPVGADEVAVLRDMYDDLEAAYDSTWAVSAVVRAVLLSPEFLYRHEVGPEGEGVVTLDPDEIASLLAFSL